jgi:hypothetical protein
VARTHRDFDHQYASETGILVAELLPDELQW